MGQVKGVDGTQNHIQAMSFSGAEVFEQATVTESPSGRARWKVPERLPQRRLIVWGAWRRKSPKSGAMRWITGSMG